MHSAANSRNRVGGFRPSKVGSLFSFSLDMTRHRRYEKRPTEIFRNDLPRLVNSGQKIVPISHALSHAPRLTAARQLRQFRDIHGNQRGEAMKRRKRKTKRLELPDENHARGGITHRRRRLLPIWSVRHLPDGTQAFFNTKRECLEWIKRWKED